MESLLASYASSDEEEEQNQGPAAPAPPATARPAPAFPSSSSSVGALFSSLPQPKPAFSSIPNPRLPKPEFGSYGDDPEPPNPRSKVFPALPQPKRVVQIRPQINFPYRKGADFDDDDEDDDEGEKEKKRKRDLASAALNKSAQSFLSSMPAPRNSAGLGALPSSGSGRRTIVDTDASAPTSSGSLAGNDQSGLEQQNAEGYTDYADRDSLAYAQSGAPSYGDFGGNSGVQVGVDQSNEGYYGSYVDPTGGNYVDYDSSYANYYEAGLDQSASGGENSGYGGYGGHGNGGNDSNIDSLIRVKGKRGRSEMPAEIVEVKQDELMKNRPREDQMKLTGIAFGPAHQPVSTKGKPTKLHKRKHQIGTLFYDMKQNATELAERRARGYLTKSQTQAKYGWS